MSKLKISIITIFAAAISVTGLVVFKSNLSEAVTADDWRAGNIVDDFLFANSDDMSVADIQAFLNSINPNCDTNGSQPATEYGRPDLTHAQYAALRGWSGPPYICLKDYYEVPKYTPGDYIPANNYSGSIPSGAVSAAQIIYDAAKRNNLNAKVILVKIATESAGPLTTDRWPLQHQYTYAMGSHCPDSGPGGSANCDRNYAGFSMQVSSGAELMRWYLDSMEKPWWTYKKPFQNNSILWNVAPSGCGRPGPEAMPKEEKAAVDRALLDKYAGPRYFHTGSVVWDQDEGGPWLDLVEARQQVARVAEARALGPDGAERIEGLLDDLAETQPSRAVGGKRLNLFRLNMALDELK